MEINMTLHLPRDAASVPVSRQVLDSCLQTLGVRPDTRADIALAQVSAKDCRCAIEVVNTSGNNGESARVGAIAVSSDPVPEYAEHGRGLKIIDAVADNLQLTGNESQGTIVRFEKTLQWLPGAAGQYLISTDNGSNHGDSW
jgi:serine/threonine-protein kinase RsbW